MHDLPQVYQQQELTFELGLGVISLPQKHVIKVVTWALVTVFPRGL